MRIVLIFLLAASFLFGCVTPQEEGSRPPKRVKRGILFPKPKPPKAKAAPAPKPQQQPVPDPSKPKPPVQYTRPTIRGNSITGPRTFSLPTIIHHRDQSVMVRIPAGAYKVPSYRVFPARVGDNTRLEHKNLPGFFIDQTEITVAQYKRFNPDYDETIYTDGQECPECPVMAVDWLYAQRYCQWAGKRLPTETEWEAAARGHSDYKYPWGNEAQKTSANILGIVDGFDGPAPVGSFPKGASPSGVLDMIGNVWEWVSTRIVLAPLTDMNPPLQKDSPYLVKGGSWQSPSKMASISYRNLVDPRMKNPAFGFRCAKSANSE